MDSPAMDIPFDNSYSKMPERFFVQQPPTAVADAQLIGVNTALALELGIDPTWLVSDQGVSVLAGNAIATGSEPLAQVYAGHQFGGFSQQLGDGRAVLLGEVLDLTGKRLDIQLKGSGRTPFSRGGDGKSALGPVIREYIVSEAMTALGIPSTRALAAISTGETVLRQEGHIAGGVFTRVAASHLRIGTFEYFSARSDIEALTLLADYALQRHYPKAQSTENPALSLLENVLAAQASLIAQWMGVGFIHGVMNTDNMSISGETIDYGPCAFMEAFHPQCVFSAIDQKARYSWGNQPNIGMWNLTRFAEALIPALDPDLTKAQQLAEGALEKFSSTFTLNYVNVFSKKLALPKGTPIETVTETLSLLANHEIDFTLFFRHLTRYAAGESSDALRALFNEQSAINAWLKDWEGIALPLELLEEMRRANPIRIPRNHRVEEAIQAAYEGDFSKFHHLNEALASPFDECPEFSKFENLPLPSQVVHQTFCGT